MLSQALGQGQGKYSTITHGMGKSGGLVPNGQYYGQSDQERGFYRERGMKVYNSGLRNQYGQRQTQPYLLVREGSTRNQFDTENEDLRQRKPRKGPRRAQGGAAYSVNNYMHESYDEPTSGAYG